jgi:hypothetical protein
VVQSIYELGAMASTRKPEGSAAKMACMKNFDALPEISEESAWESGDPPCGTDAGQGFALVLTTELRGQAVLRLRTISPRTTEQDITKSVEAMDEHSRKESSGAAVFG